VAPTLAFKLKMAKQSAERLLRDEGMATLPIDPFAIAARADITVRPKPDTEEGVSGMLLRHGNNFGILYATYVPSEGFQRFSVGHELAHYYLPGHIDHVLPGDGVHASKAGFVSADPHEMEADHFAAGTLMPTGLFRRALNRLDPGLATVERMAGLCRASLTATAIRCAEVSENAIAIIISTGPVIDFCFLSESMKSLPKLNWIRKGTPVPCGTATAALNAKPARVLAGDRVTGGVGSTDWLGGERSVTLVEEAIGLGRYGKTLTVLSSKSLALEADGFDDEAQEERDLIESYTPRFRC
jgi:hypothetical protein